MALILPKGIVVNSPEIEGNIERTDNEPLDPADIAKLWKVYTTTKRRLLDPTAERLENYWWRIWGSKRRKLNGATLARLFAQISDGQSFVPLRGPPNRDEGTPPLNTNTRLGPGASSTTALHYQNQNQSRPSTTSSSATSKAPAPMPHPILKKSRGPSASGPRPTARFISPHESEDDSDPTSSISPNSHVVVQPPSPDSQSLKSDNKSTAAHAKKKGGFVASNSAKKKTRPVIVRRQSSQNSQSSPEGAIRASEMGQSPAPVQSSSERTPPTFSTQTQSHDKQNAQSRFQENFSPSPDRGASSSKSPKTKSRTLDPKRLSPRKSSTRPRKERTGPTETLEETVVSTGDPGPSTQLRRVENLRASPVSTEELTPEELEELEMQRTLLEEANVRKKSKSNPQVVSPTTSEGFQALHSSLGSRSDGNHGPNAMGAMRMLPHDVKGTASLAPTLMAATGQIDLGDKDLLEPQQPVSDRSPIVDKGKGRDPEEVRHTDMFAKRPVPPVQVATGPDLPAPLSRSKSQLTLLLERDRARSDEVEHGGGKNSGKKS